MNTAEKGNLSIHSENILPIIKKWLYSDRDIFLRELVSNSADAITKLKRLIGLGEAADVSEEFKIRIILNAEEKTIKFIDNGIGMTAEEIKKYINQIAFSGAADFLNRYEKAAENASGENTAEIIGHFGLGFYSAFMVAQRVEIDTLSYQEGAAAAKWNCDGGIEFEITPSEKQTRGTEITLHMSEDSLDFLEDYKLRSVLRKYCGFIPIDIYFENPALSTEPNDLAPINDKSPLWQKAPKDCTDEDYRKFFHQLFVDFNEPLFWIHLNMDYPFRLKGILYFPKLKHELDSIEGQIKMFSNQVFVADNIREVVPEFLLLLKGVIDCPDLPLNVSRSFLQNDENVAKMSGYIIRKVADKLTSLASNERENYNKFWDDINQFIKYGCIREENFYDKCKTAILYKTTAGDFLTLPEYLERNEEKAGKKIIYADSANQQSQYAKLFANQGIDCVLLTSRLDVPFISLVERKEGGAYGSNEGEENNNIRFTRIDAELNEAVLDKDSETETNTDYEPLIAFFKEKLPSQSMEVETAALKDSSLPAIIILSEESRRLADMTKLYGDAFPMMMGNSETGEKLVLNKSNKLIMRLLHEISEKDSSKISSAEIAMQHIYDIAMLTHKPLDGNAMAQFIERNNIILNEFLQ
ncbi:MAG: molecular chaperone HtpG [Defluviitaleaceae bacterium]|nr:molecular chaperone HtpG [Defluviitaleaceae bacterium]